MEVSGRKSTGGDLIKANVMCDLCKLLHKHEPAEHYCADCDEFLCASCFIIHKGSKLSRNHRLLGRDEMPKQKLSSSGESICSKHSGKVLEYFCKVHSDFLCTVCVTIGHNQCGVHFIDDIAFDYDKSPEVKSLMDNISVLTQSFQNIKKAAAQNGQHSKDVLEQFKSDVRKFRLEINTILDSMENSVLKKAKKMKESAISSAECVSTRCDSMIDYLQGATSNLEKLIKYNRKRQLVVTVKETQVRVKSIDSILADLSNKQRIRNYTFQPNKKIIQSLQSIDCLGYMNDRQKTEVSIQAFEEEKVMKMKQSDHKSVRAIYVGQLNIKHPQDSLTCIIPGSAMMDSSRLVLTDRNNCSVKIVDVNYNKVTSYVRLSKWPWDITYIGNNQLVVACNDALVFLTVGQTLTINKEVKVDGVCRGIIFNDNKFIVSFEGPEPAVKVMSLNGEILKTFVKDTKGRSLFNDPGYICLSLDKTTLFVSDRDTNRVTSLNFEGTIQHEYVDDKLKNPRGLTKDKHGNIYIAGFTSNNIHQISTQCRPIQIQLEDSHRMRVPQSLTYCEQEEKLYISHFGWGNSDLNNVVSVYELK